MSAFNYVTIWCDGEAGVPQSCGKWKNGATIAAARAFAARQGWQTDVEGRLDFCPEHRRGWALLVFASLAEYEQIDGLWPGINDEPAVNPRSSDSENRRTT